MKLLSTQYTLSTKTFEIYLAGCARNPHCKGCFNEESWDFNKGEIIDENIIKDIKEKINDFPNLINNIAILGGEPLDQDLDSLINLLSQLRNINKPIWLYTSYELNEISEEIKRYCDYIKTGRYIQKLKTEDNIQEGIKLASSNQRLNQKGVDY